MYGQFLREVGLMASGQIAYEEDIVRALKTLHAFIGLLSGKNFGKLIVKSRELADINPMTPSATISQLVIKHFQEHRVNKAQIKKIQFSNQPAIATLTSFIFI